MVSYARKSGIYGINIETDGLLLDKSMSEQLIAAGVSVVTVWLDGWDSPTYKLAKATDSEIEPVKANVDYFIEKSHGTDSIVVPAMTKTMATLVDMEPFYDQWRRAGAISIVTGYDYYCGFSDDKSVMNMCPPARSRCNSLFRSMMIHSDGNVVLCSQDYAGMCILGNVFADSIIDIWHSETIKKIRADHLAGEFAICQLCDCCRHWFR